MRRRSFLGTAGALTLALPAASLANQHGFPTKPITLVVPLAPGDAADTVARMLSEALSQSLGQPVLVNNQPGAGGSIGTQAVMRAAADGYTVLYAQNSPLTIRRVIDPANNAYDPLKDLTPLALTTRTPSILVARADAPFATFQEMIAAAKAKPGTIRIGSAGPGSAGDLSVQLINRMAGTDIASVPYRGAAPAVSDVIGGHVDGVILALGALSSHIKAGTLRGLATSDAFPEFPDVPTLTALGYPRELLGIWFAFLAPAGIPANARQALESALQKATTDPTIIERLKPMGLLLQWEPASALERAITQETDTVRELVQQTQIGTS